MWQRALLAILVALMSVVLGSGSLVAQGEEAIVGDVVAVERDEASGVARLLVRVQAFPEGSEVIAVDPSGSTLQAQGLDLRTGDKVVVAKVRHVSGSFRYAVVDVYRTPWLIVLTLVFAIMVVAAGGFHGVRSLVGLVVTFAVVIGVLVPGILQGYSPIAVSLVACGLVVFITLYLVHGFSMKTTTAVLGTLMALGFTGALAGWAVDYTRLTGLGTEEAAFLQLATGGSIDIRGLLLGGIILGALGVIDDVTVSQAAIVFELQRANPALGVAELFRRGMNVGRDHIASTVNTLVLAYTGASMPLLLLFTIGGSRWDTLVSQEMLAVEVVRTLVGSAGIVTAVPVTSLVAAVLAKWRWSGATLP